MNVTFKRLVGPEYMIPAMRVTTGKDMFENKMPLLDTWYKMLLSEHSSPRVVKYRVYCIDVPYYIHTHLVRHHVGFEPYVMSQRKNKDRDQAPQGQLIDMFFDANAQALVNIARKRLCYKAHEAAQDIFEKLKTALIYHGDLYDRILGNLLMRPCGWYPGLCSEPESCGRVCGVRQLSDVHVQALEDVKED